MDIKYFLDEDNCLTEIYVRSLNSFELKKDIIEIKIPSEIDGKKILKIGGDSIGKDIVRLSSFVESVIKQFCYINFIIEDGPIEIKTFILNNKLEFPIKLNIPKTIKTIKSCAFSFNIIEDIIFENSIETIENSVFSNCVFNHKFILPKSVKIINFNSFEECKFKDGFEIPLDAKLNTINSHAFTNTIFNTDILNFNDDLEFIGQSAFSNCLSLKNVQFSKNSNIKCIEDFAFKGSSLEYIAIKSINEHVRLGSYCFYKSPNLKYVDLSEITTDIIPFKTFCNCKKLETIKIPKGVTELRKSCFADTKIVSFKSNTIKKIESLVFYNCSNLSICDLSEAPLSEIGESVFYNNHALRTLKFPIYIGNISKNVFLNFSDEEIDTILTENGNIFINIIR